MIYLGLAGESVRPFALKRAPTGSVQLPTEGIGKYQKFLGAVGVPVRTPTGAAEDDSKGYALSADPTLRAAQLAKREYATHHEQIIRRVLRSSSNVESRQAASDLLGYVKQSQRQIDAPVAACRDPESVVRNNALRALEVLAASSKRIAAMIRPSAFIAC